MNNKTFWSIFNAIEKASSPEESEKVFKSLKRGQRKAYYKKFANVFPPVDMSKANSINRGGAAELLVGETA